MEIKMRLNKNVLRLWSKQMLHSFKNKRMVLILLSELLELWICLAA